MTVLKVREIINGLKRKGFSLAQSDHKHLVFHVNGKKTSIFTFVSHGTNEIGDYLINRMSIQVKLEKKQFIDLINCPLTNEDYLKELKSQGYCFT